MDEARSGQAHLALGYQSWTAYLADVFGEEPLRLPRDQRQELVGYLTGVGMSSTAIAPIVGSPVVRSTWLISPPGVTGRRVRQIASQVGSDFRPDPAANDLAGVKKLTPAVNREVGQIDPPASTVNRTTGEVLDPMNIPEPAPSATGEAIPGDGATKPMETNTPSAPESTTKR